MTSFFGQFVMRTGEAGRAFEPHPTVVDALARGLSVERYRSLPLKIYHVVWHFNPVSVAAASRLDDALREVRYDLFAHMHEELRHEQWLLADLDAVGVPRAKVLAHAPSAYTPALVCYNYWAADRRHLASVLGTLHVLEVIASVYGGAFASAVQESPPLDGQRGVSFIALHASLDAEHMATLRDVLDDLHAPAAKCGTRCRARTWPASSTSVTTWRCSCCYCCAHSTATRCVCTAAAASTWSGVWSAPPRMSCTLSRWSRATRWPAASRQCCPSTKSSSIAARRADSPKCCSTCSPAWAPDRSRSVAPGWPRCATPYWSRASRCWPTSTSGPTRRWRCASATCG